MWQPTHVKVTVKQAKNLLAKGKNGTNDAFVVIGIGKEKYQTSVKEKASSSLVDWREECELAIPSQGNKAIIQLTVFHNKGLGLEDFLGQISLPLSDFDVYDKPKCRSYKLKGKPEKDKKKGQKERGELDVMVSFTVKSGSLLDINKKEKHKSSITSLKHLGGSLMSIGSKEKQGLKNFAKSVSSKMDKIAKPKKHRKISNNSSSGLPNDLMVSQQYSGYADPGVISDDEDADDFRFDDVKLNTRTSSPMSTMSRGSSLAQEQVLDTVTGSTENISRSGSRSSLNNTSRESSLHELRKEDSFTRLPEVKALTLERNIVNDFGDDGKKLKKAKSKVSLKSRLFTKGESREKLNEEGRFVEGGNDRLPTLTMRSSKLPQEIHDKFAGKSREDLLEVILNLQSNLDRQMKHSNDLENYIDNLLLRVMEATPHILQTPIETGNTFKYDLVSLDRPSSTVHISL